MPTYTKPEWVHVEPGRGTAGITVALGVLALIAFAVTEVVTSEAFTIAADVAIALGGVAALAGASLAARELRRTRGMMWRPPVKPPADVPALADATTALQAPRRLAIEAPRPVIPGALAARALREGSHDAA